MKILVIDDEEEVLNVLNDILTTEGHEVILARDVKDGLENVTDAIDVIITDLRMRMAEVGGEQYIEIVKVRYPRIPIIVLSAFVESEEELLSLGASKVLNKPVSIEPLLAAIEEVTKKK